MVEGGSHEDSSIERSEASLSRWIRYADLASPTRSGRDTVDIWGGAAVGCHALRTLPPSSSNPLGLLSMSFARSSAISFARIVKAVMESWRGDRVSADGSATSDRA